MENNDDMTITFSFQPFQSFKWVLKMQKCTRKQ